MYTHTHTHTHTQALMMEEVQVADHSDSFGSLPTVSGLITEKVHLSGDGPTAYAKYSTLSWGEKINRARLYGVTGEVNLFQHNV